MLHPIIRAPITWEVQGEPVHSPMVEARIGGVPTKLIVDTGSTDHVLTMDLVRRAGLAHERGEDGTDAAGTTIESWSIGTVDVTIGQSAFDLEKVVAFEGPEPFAGWAIGGFLSPQHLHRTARVVLDFVESELAVIEDEPHEAVAAVADRHPELRAVWLERQSGDGTILVRAAIDGHPEVVTMLDAAGRRPSSARAPCRASAAARPS